MGLVLLYLTLALALSFLCSILEAVLLSTPMSYISTKEKTHGKSAILLKKFKQDIDRPIAAILSLNTIAHTVGAAGVGAEAVKIFGEAYFGVISAILTILILVLSEIIPKTIGACYWRTKQPQLDGSLRRKPLRTQEAHLHRCRRGQLRTVAEPGTGTAPRIGPLPPGTLRPRM